MPRARAYRTPSRPRVALLIESSRAYGRGLLQGIARYIRTHGPWSVSFQERRASDPPPAWLTQWRGDGIIARVEDRALAKVIARLKVPAVDLRGLLRDLPHPLIETDDRLVVDAAAEHLLSRGFRHFAFCGFPGANYSDVRSELFTARLHREGVPCHVYQPPRRLRSEASFKQEQQGLELEGDVGRWIRSLPKPLALLACNDIRGQQVLNVCRQHDIAVPEQVAVLGVDNDTVLCELSDPPLSSVIPDTDRIGFEAAALLDRLMRGEAAPAGTTYIPPLGVATRRSTEVLAVSDRHVATAIQFIRDNACAGISVADVVASLPLSRSALERRFDAHLGRAPKAEILRVQIERAKQLLAESDLPLKTVAERCGFTHPEYLSVIFKKKTGTTPGRFRAKAR